MEWIMRQVCFAAFVLPVGTLLRMGVFSPRSESAFLESRQLSVPILLYAAAELCCYGRGAAVLLPIRMLELCYGTCLYLGLYALLCLLRTGRLRRILRALLFPFCVWETALLGFVLLKNGYCRGTSAAILGVLGMAAAVSVLLAAARKAH